MAGLLCDPCFNRLADMFSDIRIYLGMLDDVREHSVAAMHDPSMKLRSIASEQNPMNMQVLAMEDKRTTPRLVERDDGSVETVGPVSISRVLSGWCQVVVEERRLSDDVHTVERCLAVLRANVDWCAGQDWIGDMYDEVDVLHKQLGDVVGESRPKPVGRCPEPDCDTPLFMPEENQPLVCRGCGASWDRSQWGILAAAIASAVSA